MRGVQTLAASMLKRPERASPLAPCVGKHHSARRRTTAANGRPGVPHIFLDKHMLRGVYKESGICVRSHCGAEPPRDLEPPRVVTTVSWRDRAPTWYAAADRVEAPASIARRRFRRIHGGRATPSLPAET